VKARREAEKKLKEAHSDLANLIDDAQKRLAKATDKTKQSINSAIDQAKESKDKVKATLSAIHEGDSDDKDLQVAIKEADKAIAHLKKYLSADEKTKNRTTKK
jgi:Sec-independent protein translocase protein TatA